jgi:uncharacterized membrane protein YfcA
VHIDLYLSLAGLIVGFVVGLTGMGGGALMTPVLVLLFNVQPLAAVSSDLVAALVMKPIGGAVHARRGTVNKSLVGWLCVGSVPAAFCGVLILKSLGNNVEGTVKTFLGWALVIAATTMVIKAVMTLITRTKEEKAGISSSARVEDIVVRPVPTIVIGALGGLLVGMTSVGSGSLIIVMLLLLYPKIKANQLVGTDLVQAVPLVASAALGHLLFGDFQLSLTTSLLIGALPGVYIGARVSAGAPGFIVRRALVIVLLASALKMLGVATVTLGYVMGAIIIGGPLAWIAFRTLLTRSVDAKAEAAAASAPAAESLPPSQPTAGAASVNEVPVNEVPEMAEANRTA